MAINIKDYYLKIYTPTFKVSQDMVKPYLSPEQLLILTALQYGESRFGESRASIEAYTKIVGTTYVTLHALHITGSKIMFAIPSNLRLKILVGLQMLN